MLAFQDALDVEKDEPLDSSGPHRLRNVPADLGSTDDVQHSPASEVDEEKPARASASRLPRVLKSRLPLKSGKQSSVRETTRTKPGSPPRWETSRPCEDSSWSSCADRDAIKNVSVHDGFFQFDLQIELMNLVCPSEAI